MKLVFHLCEKISGIVLLSLAHECVDAINPPIHTEIEHPVVRVRLRESLFFEGHFNIPGFAGFQAFAPAGTRDWRFFFSLSASFVRFSGFSLT